jgi:hypothetical protein
MAEACFKDAKMSEMLPNFLIIGAQKSGTTTLAKYLRTHPQVFLSPGKEVHYFNRYYHRGIDWYKGRFSGATTEDAVGEATPTYMYFDRVPQRMAEVIPDARLIAILRNPVDRAYSHYWHQRSRGREKREFAQAVAAEVKQRSAGGRESQLPYLDQGRYLAQLALLVAVFEEFCQSPLETFQSVCQFLMVDDTFVPPNLGVAFNRFASARSLKLRSIARRIRPFRRMGVRISTQLSSYPPMDPSLRTELLGLPSSSAIAARVFTGRGLSTE